jgi:hypothetical protein
MTIFTDAALITATVMGPVLAVQTQKWIERVRARHDAQQRIFNTLMATRAARVSPGHVEALNAIDIHFRGNGWRIPTGKEREVSRRWRIYADHLNVDVNEDNPAALTAWSVNRDEYFTDLLEAMTKALGYTFDRVELKRGIYSPKAHGDAELEQRIILRGLVELLTGRQPLAMKVTDFPVSEEGIELQLAVNRRLLVVLEKLESKLDQEQRRPPSPFAQAAE